MNTGTILACPCCGAQFRRRFVPVSFLNDARAESERLREVIREAHALLGRHEHDRATGLLSSSINLYGEHLKNALRGAS